MRYVVLDVCQNWGLNPEGEWLDISINTKMEMIAKRQLEIERDNRIHKKMKENSKK